MSKEMTAEDYLQEEIDSADVIVNTTIVRYYGDLRAKEAVKEFAEELTRRRNLIISEPDGIVRETMIANLLVDLQKGVEI